MSGFQDPLRAGTAAPAATSQVSVEVEIGPQDETEVTHVAQPSPFGDPETLAEPAPSENHSAEFVPEAVEAPAEPEAPQFTNDGPVLRDINGPAEVLETLRPVPRIAMHAWCETEGVARPIIRAGDDRRMAKVQARVEPGGIPAAAESYAYAATPNLLIIETRAQPSELMAQLEPLAEVCDPSTKVVVIGHFNDIGLYRELIRSGISEYLVAPVSVADIIGVASSIFVDPEAEPLGRTVAFVGTRGGAGSSTICHNAAFAASRLFGTEVILADLDLPFGTANINFDQDPAMGMAEAVGSPERLDDTYFDRLLTKCSDNLSLLAAPSMLDRPYDFDSDAFTNLMDVAQRGAPTVILDVPHMWSEWTRDVLARADELVLVATPDLTSLRNAKNLVDTLSGMRPTDGPPKLVMNQVGIPKRPEIGVDDFADPLGIKPIATLTFDPVLFGNAANNGQMLQEADPKHDAATAISDIAHAITGRTTAKAVKAKKASSFLSRLTKRTG